MRDKILATLAVLGLLGSLAASAAATPAQRCDRDGCWTYNCDATSNHCHRHWISSTPRADATAPVATPDPAHPDQLCDSNGDNCQAPPPPR
jgi:hypothetical protein